MREIERGGGERGHHACSRNDILCIRNKWNREEPRAVGPSKPIEQANGSCYRTYYPAVTCVRDLCRSRRLSMADKFSDGKRSGPDKSSRLPAKLVREANAPLLDTSTTAPEVYIRRLTRGNGPRERSVPKFFPGILYSL